MTDDQLFFLDCSEIARLLHTRKVSPVELTRSMLERIARVDPHLAAFARVTPELALQQARDAEKLLMQHRILGPLHGVPIAIKDLCYTKGIATAAGMPIHANFVPTFNATAVSRLRDAGAVLLGKLQLTEGALVDHHPDVRVPVNPWNDQGWSGASSSGSGVATAAGLCYASLGSDTGGSIRFPSAANGVTGLKPTWGRVSVNGCFELAASLDHLGPMCRSAADCGAVLGIIAGADPHDPTALQAPVPDYLAGTDRDLHGVCIGFDPAYASRDVDPATSAALARVRDTLAGLGAEFHTLTFPDPTDVIADWAAQCSVETAVAHAATFPAQRSAYGPGLAEFIDGGRTVKALDLQQVWLRRRRYCGRVAAMFEGVDLLLIPAQPMAPLTIRQMKELGADPLGFSRLVHFTAPFNSTGSPTITFPAGFTADRLPIGVQLIARHLDEALLVRAGRAFQRVTDWHRKRPTVRG